MNRLTLNNNIEIDGIEISDQVFQEEMVDWNVEDRESYIDLLIDWISECGSDRQSDKYLMKEDLTMMIGKGNLGDNQTFFKSISTNEYLFWDDGGFDEVCDEILKLNKSITLQEKQNKEIENGNK